VFLQGKGRFWKEGEGCFLGRANWESKGCSLLELSLSRGGTWARETDLKSVWGGGLCRGASGAEPCGGFPN
jgi:hypothetical protein